MTAIKSATQQDKDIKVIEILEITPIKDKLALKNWFLEHATPVFSHTFLNSAIFTKNSIPEYATPMPEPVKKTWEKVLEILQVTEITHFLFK